MSGISESARILTVDGWVDIKDIQPIDIVLTLNLKTNTPEYQPLLKKTINSINKDVIKLKGENLNTQVSLDYPLIIKSRNSNINLMLADDLFNKNIKVNTHLSIPKSCKPWEMQSNSKFTIKGCDISLFSNRMRKDLKEKYSHDIDIDYGLWMSFIGLYLAEGHTSQTMRESNAVSKNTSYGVFVSQKNQEKLNKIRSLLNNFPEELKWTENNKSNSTAKIFSISDARLFNYLFPLGSCYTKYIPPELKQQSSPLLEKMLEWYHVGDGRSVIDRGNLVKNIFSTSKRMMEDFQDIQVKVGRNGNILETKPKEDYIYDNHLIKAENKSSLYTLKFNKSNNIYIDNRFLKITKEHYNGRVYAISTENKSFYCQDNGKCFWCGCY